MEDSATSSSDSLALSNSSSDGSEATSPHCESVKEYCPEQRYDRERGVFSLVSSGGAKRLHYSNEDDDGSYEEEETTMDNDQIHCEYDAINSNSDDQDDDYSSDCSGSTVVASGFPPPPENATQEEMTIYYWELCYGDDAKVMMESQQEHARRAGSRSAPAKSWSVIYCICLVGYAVFVSFITIHQHTSNPACSVFLHRKTKAKSGPHPP